MIKIVIKVTPRSSRNQIELGEINRAWVQAPPVDGEANEAVRDLLCRTFGVSRGSVTLIRGESSRQKTFILEGVTEDDWKRVAKQQHSTD